MYKNLRVIDVIRLKHGSLYKVSDKKIKFTIGFDYGPNIATQGRVEDIILALKALPTFNK